MSARVKDRLTFGDITSLDAAGLAKFEGLVDRSGGPDVCHPWLGYSTPEGYGQFRYKNVRTYAHRLAFILANGPIPPGASILHHCDNPPCCNPRCLFAGTHAENMADRNAKGRQASGDRHGSRRAPGRVRRGSSHRNAKLTEAEALAIWRARPQGAELARWAERLGVTTGTLYSVLSGRCWSHVTLRDTMSGEFSPAKDVA